MRWRGLPGEGLAWREFDDEAVVRNARTGSTHLLEALPAEILRILSAADRPLTAAEVADRLGDNDGAWAHAIEEVLNDFQRLGLAEREADESPTSPSRN